MTKIFVTGGTGYVGTEVIKVGLQLGDELTVLTRSEEKANALKVRGVHAIVGDLMEDGEWQSALEEAEYVIHLAAPPSWGQKVTEEVAANFGKGHYDMTARLLDHVNPEKIKKIVYIAGASFFGSTEDDFAKDETYTSDPKGWGPYIEASVNLLTEYIKKGLPIVTAFPTQIYGPSSWLVQLLLEPISNSKPMYRLEGSNAYNSPIHIHDCAKACLFLVEHGVAGERYLVCDDEPMPYLDFKKVVEKSLGKEGAVIYIPREQALAAIGPVLTEYAMSHNYFSNKKLKELGFQFTYPTAHDGIPHVVSEWKKTTE